MRRTIAALVFALLVACTRETPQRPPAEKPPVPVAPRDGGRVVLRLESPVSSLNYVLHTTEDERQVLSFLYDPLIAFNRELAPIPATATRWEVLDDGRTYILHLDPRATFSDGQPVRASDVVFTLHKILDEESMQFGSWFELLDREQTKAINERTVRVAFKERRAAQLLAFNIGVLPEHVYGKGDFKKNKAAIGNGPYVLKQRTSERIVLERRDDYWREKPRIASVLFRPMANNAVAWKALQRGDVDVSRVDNDVWARVKDDAAITSRLAFHNVFRLGYNCIVWNLTDPILSDVRVRRALAMSFDRQTVIDKLYHGQARAVTGPFTPDQSANNPEVQAIEFNPTAAAALLSSAGWNDSDGDGIRDREGKKFELTILVLTGNDASREQAQVLQDALRRIGVQLELRLSEEAAFYELVLARNFQAAYLAWINEPDPDPYGLFHSSQIEGGMNVVSYKSEEADQLIEEARGELDPARRTDLHHQLHEVLARDQPYLWTVQVAEKWAVNKRVQNVAVSNGLGLYHWSPGPRAWWLADRVARAAAAGGSYSAAAGATSSSR
jgi:peptide/nickel transport system substrate-binding protein